MSSMDIPRRGRAPGASAGPHPQAEEHLQRPSREVRALQQAALGLAGGLVSELAGSRERKPFLLFLQKEEICLFYRCALCPETLQRGPAFTGLFQSSHPGVEAYPNKHNFLLNKIIPWTPD